MDKKIIQFEFNNSQKTYANGTIALAHFYLSAKQGERLAIIGPSGCGKSTILRLISGLDQPDDISSFTIYNNSEVGYVFQDANLMSWANVFENVYMPLRLQGIARQKAKGKINALLKKLSLENCQKLFPYQLSGGMKMRVSIARALIVEPQILLLDEPFAALDEITRFRLNDLLLDLQAQKKFTMVLVTHSIFESVYLSERVAIMGYSNKGGGVIYKEIKFNKRVKNYRESKLYGENCVLLSKQLKKIMQVATKPRRTMKAKQK